LASIIMPFIALTLAGMASAARAIPYEATAKSAAEVKRLVARILLSP
jgi:hypothetical protein